jgi:hypothetical protein
MGLTPRFNKNYVLNELEKGKLKIERGLLGTLQLLGEEFVREAREALDIDPGLFPKGDYHDRTANLRSSIAYFVLNDGKIVGDNTLGTAEGEAAARAVLEATPGLDVGYVLVGVAGMEYAGYVESKGYNVISSQANSLFLKLPGYLQKVVARANKLGVDMGFDQSGDLITTSVHRVE